MKRQLATTSCAQAAKLWREVPSQNGTLCLSGALSMSELGGMEWMGRSGWGWSGQVTLDVRSGQVGTLGLVQEEQQEQVEGGTSPGPLPRVFSGSGQGSSMYTVPTVPRAHRRSLTTCWRGQCGNVGAVCEAARSFLSKTTALCLLGPPFASIHVFFNDERE